MIITRGKVGLRRGMWVVVDGKVGLVGARPTATEVEVHLVDNEGDTHLVTKVPPKAVRQALYAEIPEARRPIKAVAEMFGYM